jgi:hypothetical protein
MKGFIASAVAFLVILNAVIGSVVFWKWIVSRII